MTVFSIDGKVPVRVTRKGARFFELLRDGYDEMEAMRIAASEHGPKLVDAPARGEGCKMPAETETQTAELLRTRIEKQVGDALASIKGTLEDARVARARSEWLADAVSGRGSGIIQ